MERKLLHRLLSKSFSKKNKKSKCCKLGIKDPPNVQGRRRLHSMQICDEQRISSHLLITESLHQ